MEPGSISVHTGFHPWASTVVTYLGEHITFKAGVNAEDYLKVTYAAAQPDVVRLPIQNHTELLKARSIEAAKYGPGPVPACDDNFDGTQQGGSPNRFYSMTVDVPPGLLQLLDRPGPLSVFVNLSVENRSGDIPSKQALGNDPQPSVTLDLGAWITGAVLSSSSFTHGLRLWRYRMLIAGIAAVVPQATLSVRWDFPMVTVASGQFNMELEFQIIYNPGFIDARWLDGSPSRSARVSLSTESSFEHLSDLGE